MALSVSTESCEQSLSLKGRERTPVSRKLLLQTCRPPRNDVCADVAACGNVLTKTNYISKRADYKLRRLMALSVPTMHDSYSCNLPARRRARSASFADKGAVGVCISPLGRKVPCRRKYLGSGISHKSFFTSLGSARTKETVGHVDM